MGGKEAAITIFITLGYVAARFYSSSLSNRCPSREKPKVLALDHYTLEGDERLIVSEKGACSICLRDFKAGDTLTRGQACGHTFHKECLAMWLPKSSTCPYCRHDLEERSNTGSSAEIQKSGAFGIFDELLDFIYT